MTRKLVIAAACARPYVAMAVAAGYDVLALDIFADADTKALASQVFKLPYQHGSFELGSFVAALQEIQIAHEVTGFVYGSGFEMDPTLLEIAATHMPLLGNNADVVANAKAVPGFFNLLAELEIPYPLTVFAPPAAKGGWLIKQQGGSGGTHIKRVGGQERIHPQDYYQREVVGVPVSLLFAADGVDVTVIGYNRQEVSAFADLPFRYAGLVSHAVLPTSCCAVLESAAKKLTAALKLKGLNSVDAILTPDDNVFVLELNPRLTASVAAYESSPSLLDVHLNACQGALLDIKIAQHAKAQAVFYASAAFKIPESFDWPVWVTDVPVAGSYVKAGDPVCSVHAKAETARSAWVLAQQRLQKIARMQRASQASH